MGPTLAKPINNIGYSIDTSVYHSETAKISIVADGLYFYFYRST